MYKDITTLGTVCKFVKKRGGKTADCRFFFVCLEQQTDGVLVDLTPLARRILDSLLGLLSKEDLLFSVNDILEGVEVCLVGLNHLGLHDDLVAKNHDEVHRDTNVTGNEGSLVKGEDESSEVLENSNENAESKSNVGTVRLEGSLVDKVPITVNALGLESFHEEDVSDKNGNPGEQTQNGNNVDKVSKDLGRVVRAVKVGQGAEKGGESKSVVRNTHLVGGGEDSGSLAIDRHTVEGSGGNVKVGVGCGEDEKQDGSVDDLGEDLDTSVLDGDDEGRGRGRGGGLVGKEELLIVVSNAHTEEEDGNNVEDHDTVEGKFDGTGDISSRVLGLTNSDTD